MNFLLFLPKVLLFQSPCQIIIHSLLNPLFPLHNVNSTSTSLSLTLYSYSFLPTPTTTTNVSLPSTQFRVESMMLRISRGRNMVAISPSIQQRAAMKAPEWIALTMEPQSRCVCVNFWMCQPKAFKSQL